MEKEVRRMLLSVCHLSSSFVLFAESEDLVPIKQYPNHIMDDDLIEDDEVSHMTKTLC